MKPLPPAGFLFGRSEALSAPALLRAFGARGLIINGASPARAAWAIDALSGCALLGLPIASEPQLHDLITAPPEARAHRPDWVAAIGGGAALDFGTALAALIPQPGDPMDQLEMVGHGLPLNEPLALHSHPHHRRHRRRGHQERRHRYPPIWPQSLAALSRHAGAAGGH